MNIEEGNKLIAEFMGVYSWDDNRYGLMWKNPVSGSSSKSLQYHSSWDWLMPVVEKIEKTKIGKDRLPVVTIEPGYCVVSDNGESPIREEQGDDKIENVWFAVIGFIEWYNARNNLTP